MALPRPAPFVAAALLAAAVLLVVPRQAAASESAPVTSPRATVTLMSESDSVAPGKPMRVGLRIRLAPGWHTYWRNPGDAGTPPDIAWQLPAGTTAGPIEWPVPQRLPEGPVMTFSFTGEVLLPVVVTPAGTAGALHLEADASWLVCERTCVPEEGHLSLDLPAGDGAPGRDAPLFAAAEARMPQPSPFPARIAPDGTLVLTGAGLSPERVRDADFFPDAAGAFDLGTRPQLAVRDGVLTLRQKPGPAFPAQAPVGGVLVLRDRAGGETALRIDATPGPAADPAPAAAAPVWQLLGLALLGGLILNLMPCVFPVLAMKAFSIARLSGVARGTVRAHALSYTAGVLLAFLTLGGVLLALRAGGEAAGWGFQFQSPLFVAAMAWMVFAVGLNLSGVFELGGGLAGAGQGLAARDGHLGSFGTGLLAVLVATPCTAPFMGAAIAGALAAPAPLTLAVFAAMGLGLAAPYGLLALWPRLAGLLPKPGGWMEVLRQFLAFPMFAAAIWLVWVLGQQAGPDAVLLALSGMGLLGFAGWALGLVQRGARRGWRHVGQAATAAALLGVVALGGAVATAPPDAGTEAAAPGVERFSAARLAELRAAGRPVFVNMTAAWCVTCLVNERVALDSPALRDAFARGRVVYLKGDWTRQDPEITAYLRQMGRDGVPLYVFYPPGGEGVVLPQLLTQAAVLQQLESAGG